MNIAIIPARIGSKRIKQKNIKKFNGVPIIQYTINLLIKMKLFDKIIISTDSLKVTKIISKYQKYSEIIPYMRSKKLSGDFVSTRDVIVDVIKKNRIRNKDSVFCIYPTSIFVKKKYILKSLKNIKNKKISYIFSAKEVDRNIYRSFNFINMKLKMVFKKNYEKRTQDLKKLYCDAAQFYLAKADSWIKNKIVFSKKSDIVILGKYDVIDLDEVNDWLFAEKLYKIKNGI